MKKAYTVIELLVTVCCGLIIIASVIEVIGGLIYKGQYNAYFFPQEAQAQALQQQAQATKELATQMEERNELFKEQQQNQTNNQ
jgi:hypothetical protein